VTLLLEELVQQALRGELGSDPADLVVTGGWSTIQRSSHTGRSETYRNVVLSLRAGCAVGSCSVEFGELNQADVDDCVGRTLADLLGHQRRAIRIAALDTYLGVVAPHDVQPHVEAVEIPGGTTLEKSLFRARRVADLVQPQPGMRVALIGVVNSLIQAIRERGADCLACDFNISQTEWGDPVRRCWRDVVDDADAVLATGMTLSNATFEPLVGRARERHLPVVVYAQTGSAIVPRFVGNGVTAVSAEPFPFFSLHGGPSTIYLYRLDAG
jgi:Putative heavy-metal chelation